ncbi:hypothetical protein JXA85_06830, partial [Candidatus Woesearchaeota archaeon]|nr:hypothetical protein [Candidatus Woesearchaeota archaeon]
MHKMQHITGKEIEVMGYFYKKRKGHVRQIKKELNLSEHTLLKCLASLKRRNIVESNKEGNLKVYNLIPKHPLAKILFSYFDFQRFEGIEYNRKKAIQEFCDCAKNIKLPYFMLLFGSTAKETYNKK